MSSPKVLFGFHAVGVRLKTAPKSIIEIYYEATRRDVRMRQFLDRAREAGARLIEADSVRIAKLAGSHGHQGVAARVEPVKVATSLDELLEDLEAAGIEQPLLLVLDECTVSALGALNLCLFWCNPLLQDCPGSDLCVPTGDNFVCVPDTSGAAGQANNSCELANACDKGLVCLDPVDASSACPPQADGCCQPFCEFPGGVCPNPDQACVQWYDPMMLPPDDPKLKYGVCAIPG